MWFSNPLYIYLLAPLIVVSVLIHLLLKPKLESYYFPSIWMVKQNLPVQKRKVKFKEVIILLLRILLLIVLIFLMSDLKKEKQYIEKKQINIVFIYDNSFSMRCEYEKEGTVGELVRSRLINIMEELPEQTNTGIIQTSPELKVVQQITKNVDDSIEKIKSINLDYSNGNIIKSIELGLSVLKKVKGEKYIIIGSDLAVHTFSKINIPNDVKIFWTDEIPHKCLSNIAIDKVSVNNNQDDELKVEAFIHNYSNNNYNNLLIKLESDDKILSQNIIDNIPPGEVVKTEFVPSLNNKSSAGLKMSVDFNDGFQYDNSFYFWVGRNTNIKVLLVNGDPVPGSNRDELYYFNKILQIRGPKNITFITQQSDFVGMKKVRSKFNPEIIVMANYCNINNNDEENLRQFVAEGGSIIWAPGDQCINVKKSELLFGGDFLYLNEKKEISLKVNMDQYPALNIFKEHKKLFSSARVKSYFLIEPIHDASIPLNFEDNSPAMIEYSYGNGKIITFAFSLDLDWSNLPITPVFLPFLQELLAYLSIKSNNHDFLMKEPQDFISIKLPVESSRILIKNRQSNVIKVIQNTQMKRNISFNLPAESGLFSLWNEKQNNENIEELIDYRIALNWNRSESDLRPSYAALTLPRIRREFYSVKHSNNNMTGMNLVEFFVILSLILLFMEFYLEKKGIGWKNLFWQ